MKTPVNGNESVLYINVSTIGIACVIVGLAMALLEIFLIQNPREIFGEITSYIAAILIFVGGVTIYGEFRIEPRAEP